MIEKIIELEVADPTIFYGVNNSNIRLIKDLYPKVKIVARGTAIKIHGDEEEIALITLRYGENLDEPKTSENWDEKSRSKFYSALVPKMKKMLENSSNERIKSNMKTFTKNYK